jgi:hypothetical protein
VELYILAPHFSDAQLTQVRQLLQYMSTYSLQLLL